MKSQTKPNLAYSVQNSKFPFLFFFTRSSLNKQVGKMGNTFLKYHAKVKELIHPNVSQLVRPDHKGILVQARPHCTPTKRREERWCGVRDWQGLRIDSTIIENYDIIIRVFNPSREFCYTEVVFFCMWSFVLPAGLKRIWGTHSALSTLVCMLVSFCSACPLSNVRFLLSLDNYNTIKKNLRFQCPYPWD